MTPQPLEISHDPDMDALYITLNSGEIVHTEILDDYRLIDYDLDGRVIGIELLNVSKGVRLQHLPRADLIFDKLQSLGIPISTESP
jgi:uncharacterized protein YuzE